MFRSLPRRCICVLVKSQPSMFIAMHYIQHTSIFKICPCLHHVKVMYMLIKSSKSNQLQVQFFVCFPHHMGHIIGLSLCLARRLASVHSIPSGISILKQISIVFLLLVCLYSLYKIKSYSLATLISTTHLTQRATGFSVFFFYGLLLAG